MMNYKYFLGAKNHTYFMGFLWSLLLMCGWMMYGAAKFWSQSCPGYVQPHTSGLVHHISSSTTTVKSHILPVVSSNGPTFGTAFINKEHLTSSAHESQNVQVTVTG